jgi:acyl-CoA reductase-like NAD-dependent aldehyde dehydrogenase
MDPQIATVLDTAATETGAKARADMILERAGWAAQVFSRYDRAQTQTITAHVAEAAFRMAGEYGEWAVRETGFGVAAHKKLKNELSSVPLVEHFRDWDFVNARFNEETRMVEIPRPAGVVFALAPSTNPIATIYFKTLLALMTRNAIVLSPHPAARECSVDAAKMLARAAQEAGAPEGAIQVVERPNLKLIEQFMQSAKTDLILATGGTAMVRAAYSSANPAIGVGPGNAPVLVDATADLRQAAEDIVASKSFDNSILCTNESVLITLEDIAKSLSRELEKAGCHICTQEETAAIRRTLFPAGSFNIEALGRDAQFIAGLAGIKVGPKVKVIVTPIAGIGVGEDLSREKLCPVLGLYVAGNKAQALTGARQLLRFTGAGHSAAIHSKDPSMAVEFAAAVEVYRVVVNAPCSQGAAGFGTTLAPTFTIGTGFFGRSAIGENIGPQHLVHWTRVAWSTKSDPAVGGRDLAQLRQPGPLPEAPSDGVPGKGRGDVAGPRRDDLREEIRRIIAEELRQALRG